MARYTKETVTTGHAGVDLINTNLTNIQTAINDTLSRKGDSPNTMEADIDMNGFNIVNQGNALENVVINWKGAWVTATAYKIGDGVTDSGNAYICLIAHTSGTLATDVSNGKFVQVTLGDLVNDSTPQLGGNLDVQTYEITSVSSNDITLHSNNDVIAILGDAAGSKKLYIKDSAGTTVFSIDSDGNIDDIGDVASAGAITATSYGGITEANLLDKTATESITGAYTFTGAAIDMGAATTLEIPHGTSPTVSSTGHIAIDTDADGDKIDQGLIKYHDGTQAMWTCAVDTIPSTDGHVLQYNATTDKMEFASVATGDFIKLGSTTVSSPTASVDFTGLSSTYREYVIVLENVVPATDTADLLMRVSTDNGSTFKSGASDYHWAVQVASSAGTSGAGSDADNSWTITDTGGVGNDTSVGSREAAWGRVHITAHASASTRCRMNCQVSCLNSTDNMRACTASGVTDGDLNVDALRILFSPGNIASGVFVLYGVLA